MKRRPAAPELAPPEAMRRDWRRANGRSRELWLGIGLIFGCIPIELFATRRIPLPPALPFGRWFLCYALAGFLAPWPMILIAARWLINPAIERNRRAACLAHRLCAACGYDLRATPDRCPECGAGRLPSSEGSVR